MPEHTGTLAQTWPQLVRQLLDAEPERSDLALARAAHDCARDLFAGAERPEAKPFLNHLVGTASGALLAQAPPETVAAALLHAAYDQGDFGDGRPGPHPRHRQVLRRCVGPRCEAVVHRYHTLRWGPEVTRRSRAGLAQLSDFDREVLVIRLANEVDDALCGALHISGKVDHRAHGPEVHDDLVALADALTTPAFAAMARDVLLGQTPVLPLEVVVGRGRSTVRLPPSATWGARRRIARSRSILRHRSRALLHRIDRARRHRGRP